MDVERTRSDTNLDSEVSHSMTIKSYYGPIALMQYTSSTATAGYLKPYYTKDMTDVVSKEFEKRINNGEIINNPMSSTMIIFEPAKPEAVCRKEIKTTDNFVNVGGYSFEGTFPFLNSDMGNGLGIPGSYADQVATLKARAITRAHANASSAEISILMVAAEGRKTIASITETLARVAKLAKQLKRLDLQSATQTTASFRRSLRNYKKIAKRSGASLAADYMSVRYALRPLVIDVQNSLKALEKSEHYGKSRATARGFERASDEWNDVIAGTESDGTYLYDLRRKTRVTTDIRAGVLTDIDVSAMSNWGMDQILETAWEIVPFSFVIDWFLNVGQTIAAWAPSAGITELASWVTVIQTETYNIDAENFSNVYAPSNTVADQFDWSGHNKVTVIRKTRTIEPNLAILPSFKNRMDPLKTLDLAIILKGLTNWR
jgi:hypothetical protein